MIVAELNILMCYDCIRERGKGIGGEGKIE